MSISEKLIQIAENESKVYEAGKTREWSDFWDSAQDNGTRTKYPYGFSSYVWTDENFKPKYDIRPDGSAISLFRYARITDLRYILRVCGVTLDLSKATNLEYAFQWSTITDIGIVDCTGLTDINLRSSFANCPVKNIERLVLKDTITFTGTFNNATELENIEIGSSASAVPAGAYGTGSGYDYHFVPVIGNDIDFSSCTKLTWSSLVSIICALADYSGDSATHTLTLGQTNIAKLSDTEIDIVAQRGWVLA